MADTKATNTKDTETKADEPKIDEAKAPEKKLYKLVKNVKYGAKVCKIGEKIEIDDKDLQEFKDKGLIKIDED